MKFPVVLKNGERAVIITPDYLVDTFGHLPITVFLHITFPFTLDGPDAIKEFDRLISLFELEPGGPGREDSIEGFQELKSAYLKLTVFERKSIQDGLVRKMAEMIVKEPDKVQQLLDSITLPPE